MNDILLIAVGLAMDAFGASVALAAGYKKEHLTKGWQTSLVFGTFHLIMPALGWLIGTGFRPVVAEIDHWIAFGLLTVIGGRMISGSGRGRRKIRQGKTIDPALILPLGLATSIDALIVGMGLAFLDTPLLAACSIIGGVTFLMSAAGAGLGVLWGRRVEKQAGILGGTMLILIGVKILTGHLRG